ncbi:hypothetical protein DFP72DRAFT_1127522 [Ephemerocybe angulata]|uniref:Uncharacterized protein n=1 Tax=Ephemerocybe angulata TaxID=980116 RepID=A0A8H6M432_9AGAR|nr:hypothetical protein DFP72DRAFT_1127522 [Tulosesus angulatus]
MKFAFAPILALLLCISTATAFVDYDEVDGRSLVDDLTVRGEAVSVPFQPSLRAFLEDAVTVHRRAIESINELEARDSVSLMVAVRYGAAAAKIRAPTDESQFRRTAPLTEVVKHFTGRLKLDTRKAPFKLLLDGKEVDLSKRLDQRRWTGTSFATCHIEIELPHFIDPGYLYIYTTLQKIRQAAGIDLKAIQDWVVQRSQALSIAGCPTGMGIIWDTNVNLRKGGQDSVEIRLDCFDGIISRSPGRCNFAIPASSHHLLNDKQDHSPAGFVCMN